MIDPSPSPPPSPKVPKTPGQRLLMWCMAFGLLSLVVAPALTLKLAAWKYRQETAQRAALARAKAENKAAQPFGGPFRLVDQSGAAVSDATYRGKVLLVYFGYTNCPDLCPTALQNIAETLDELGDHASRVQALFITIDPARDTPAKLKEYTASFHPDIVGLTGSPEQVAAAAKTYNVTYAKAEQVGVDDYLMDHSTYVYVVDAGGKPVKRLDMEDVDPAEIAADIRGLLTPAVSSGKQAPLWQSCRPQKTS